MQVNVFCSFSNNVWSFLRQRSILQRIAMGIHGLAKLIADQAPSAIKEQDIKNYFGKLSYPTQILLSGPQDILYS